MDILFVVGIVLFFVIVSMNEWKILFWLLLWVLRILVWLGFKVWDTGAAQVKAHQKRVEEKETMLQNPKQILVRSSEATATEELLRPAGANNREVSAELLRPSTYENIKTIQQGKST